MKRINPLRNMDAYILCGGQGKRLRTVTGAVPKPMALFGDKPFLDILIDDLKNKGFRRFILGLGYKASFIKNYYRSHSLSDAKILFCQEKSPLGTGGALKKASRFIKSRSFFVFNGDSLSDFDPLSMLNFHLKKKSILTLLVNKMKDCSEYGCVMMGPGGRILNFKEKKRKGPGFVNAGVYLFDKSVFNKMPSWTRFSLEDCFLPALCREAVYGYRNTKLFFDIGTPKRYRQAKKKLIEHG